MRKTLVESGMGSQSLSTKKLIGSLTWMVRTWPAPVPEMISSRRLLHSLKPLATLKRATLAAAGAEDHLEPAAAKLVEAAGQVEAGDVALVGEIHGVVGQGNDPEDAGVVGNRVPLRGDPQ